ncbi:MAG: ABC transporter permease [Geminicoccaceae bacterium]
MGRWLYLGAAYLFIFLPVAVLVLFSFQGGTLPVPPFTGPSLQWYAKVMADPSLTAALGRSLLVGIGSSLVATVLAFLAAWGLARHRLPRSALMRWVIVAPLTISYLVIGMGLLVTFTQMGLPKSLWAIGIGHVVINLPLAFTVIQSQLGASQATLEQAARDLGAGELQVVFWVTLPVLWPALFAAFFLSLTLSWDEFVIAFLLGQFDATLPVEIWSMLRTGLNPLTNAAGSLVFLVSIICVALAEIVLLRRRA